MTGAAVEGATGVGLFSAMTGGAGCGGGLGVDRCSSCADADGGRGGAGIAGLLCGAGGISRNDNALRACGSSPDGGSTSIFSVCGVPSNAATCSRIDNANATQILGTTTPSFLLRDSSIRSFINPMLP